ncbi:hypothetical protein VL15_38265 [Burkholderia cepacia]|uniref:Surface presentation of antigens protein SpaO n=2 Tax=Burkholderia cepacia TaxID=292 RepID=A0A0J5YRS2_BURCE|nr:hypothetical protein VL15_38265 [Burkholderia cepacia]
MPREALSADIVPTLPVPLDWLLGVSAVSLRVLRRMRPGDVMLITDARCRVHSQGMALFDYVVTEEGVVMENLIENAKELEVEAPVTSSSFNIERLPLTVEFVLQQSTVTLTTLQRMEPGQVFPMESDAARRVRLRVNGQWAAQGELVQLDAGLGVELTEIFMERGDVE